MRLPFHFRIAAPVPDPPARVGLCPSFRFQKPMRQSEGGRVNGGPGLGVWWGRVVGREGVACLRLLARVS